MLPAFRRLSGQDHVVRLDSLASDPLPAAQSGMPHRGQVALCAEPYFSYPVSDNNGI
jgi:hypothetical protein